MEPSCRRRFSPCLRRVLPWSAALLAGCAREPPEWLPCEEARGAIAFSELMPDPPGADADREWIELANIDPARAVALRGAVLTYARSREQQHARHLLTDLVVPPASFAVLASGSVAVSPEAEGTFAAATYGRGLGDMNNTTGHLQLLCGETVLDEITYGAPVQGVARAFDGRSVPSPTDNDDPARWCDARAPLPDGSFGTPGAPNEPCERPTTLACGDVTGTTPLAAPAPGDVILHELMIDPAAVADRDGEWIELLVRADVDLDGLELGHFEGDEPVVDHVLAFESCARAAAGTLLLIAANSDADQNGGVAPVSAQAPLALPNAAGRRSSLFVGHRGIVMDAVEWEESPAGASLARELDPDALPGRLCPSTTPYGLGDRGSPGAPNPPCATPSQDTTCRDEDGQERPPVVPEPGDVILTELLPDPNVLSDVAGEWVELYAHRAVDLQGITLVRDDARPVPLDQEGCLTVPAGGYVVVARREAATSPGLPENTLSAAFSLPNAGGTLALFRGDVLLDAVSWGKATSGASVAVDPTALDAAANDDPAHWCTSTQAFAGGDRGSPGAANPPCAPPDDAAPSPMDDPDETPVTASASMCQDDEGPRERRIPVPGSLVISELMADPAAVGDDAGEWFELVARASVDLNGLVIARDGLRGAPLEDDTCIAVAPGDHIVFVRRLAPEENGGIEHGLPLAVTLVQSGGTLQVLHDDVVLDEVTWDESLSGIARALTPEATDSTANDDPEHWCAAADTYGAGDRGTPGAANQPCASAATCLEDAIARPIASPRPGELRISEWMASPDAVPDARGEWFELHALADVDLNGIFVGRTYPDAGANLTTSTTCATLLAGEAIVIARAADPQENGGLADVFATFGFALPDRDGALFVATASELLDDVSWTSATAGASTIRTLDGSCTASTPYGAGDLGTPGTVNDTCP